MSVDKNLQSLCESCKVPGEPVGLGSASGRLYYQCNNKDCTNFGRQWAGKNPEAVALGARGGRKTMEKLSPEERSRKGTHAINSRWNKKKQRG